VFARHATFRQQLLCSFCLVLVLVGMDNLKRQDIGPPAYIISMRSICSYVDYLGYYKKCNKIGKDCN